MNQQFPIHAYDTRALRRPFIRPRPFVGFGGLGAPLVGGVLGGLLGSTLLNPYYGPYPFYPPYPPYPPYPAFGPVYPFGGFWW